MAWRPEGFDFKVEKVANSKKKTCEPKQPMVLAGQAGSGMGGEMATEVSGNKIQENDEEKSQIGGG